MKIKPRQLISLWDWFFLTSLQKGLCKIWEITECVFFVCKYTNKIQTIKISKFWAYKQPMKYKHSI